MQGIVMGAVFAAPKLSEDYPQLMESFHQYDSGRKTQIGRGRECIDFTLEVYEPEYCILGSPSLDSELLHLEILQTLAGVYDRAIMGSLPKVGKNYGPKAASQLVLAATELIEYPYSGHSMVYLGDDDDIWETRNRKPSERDNLIPKTSIWQFIRRANVIHLLAHAPTMDLVRDLPYEMPLAVAVQMMMAKATGCQLGLYRLRCGTAYIKDKDADVSLWGIGNGGGKLELPWLRSTVDQTAVRAEGMIFKERKKRGLETEKV